MANEKLTLTVTEMARLLGIGRGPAYEAVRKGTIPSVKIGKRLLISKQALMRILDPPKP